MVVGVLQSYSRSDTTDSWEEVICRKQMWSQRESWPPIQHETQYMWSVFLSKNVGMCVKLKRQSECCINQYMSGIIVLWKSTNC